jgi:2-dehydropantoate 2-reductase
MIDTIRLMRIAIIGAGGVGGYFGARLAEGGAEVAFLARGDHLAALRREGLRVESPRGDLHLASVRASDRAEDLGPADAVLLCVKLWDTEAAARSVAPLLGRETIVVSLQNGVQKDEVIGRFVPRENLLGGLCYVAATIARAGVVRHGGTLAKIVFGELDGRRTPRAEALLAACERGGIDVTLSTDVRREIWEKFVFLVGLSATTTTIGMPIGPIRANPQTRAFLLDVMREVVAVGRAHGVALADDYAEQRLAFCDSLPAEMSSSMHHDLRQGHRLEVPWLSGGVVELGRAVGVATPLNRAVADVLALRVEGRQET